LSSAPSIATNRSATATDSVGAGRLGKEGEAVSGAAGHRPHLEVEAGQVIGNLDWGADERAGYLAGTVGEPKPLLAVNIDVAGIPVQLHRALPGRRAEVQSRDILGQILRETGPANAQSHEGSSEGDRCFLHSLLP